MWIKFLVPGRAECAVAAVDTVDAACPSQQGGAVVHGMPDPAGHFGVDRSCCQLLRTNRL